MHIAWLMLTDLFFFFGKVRETSSDICSLQSNRFSLLALPWILLLPLELWSEACEKLGQQLQPHLLSSLRCREWIASKLEQQLMANRDFRSAMYWTILPYMDYSTLYWTNHFVISVRVCHHRVSVVTKGNEERFFLFCIRPMPFILKATFICCYFVARNKKASLS